MRLMVQTLLAERFQLKIHRETKEFAAYELVTVKGGPKLTEAADRPTNGLERAAGHLAAYGVSLQSLRVLCAFANLPSADSSRNELPYELTG